MATQVAAHIDKTGAFVRKDSVFRNWIKPDSEFPPEKDRYHLYISWACPWAHRTAIVRALKGLQDVISLSPVDFLLGPSGWTFSSENPDPNNGFQFIRQLYEQSDPQYSANYTVPVLYDKKAKRIVNNESSEIIRMLNDQFNHVAGNPSLDLYPEALRPQIDELNAWIYPNINNGVYRCGFAQSQEAYDAAFDALFEHLDKVEAILSKTRYLTGDSITEADVRLFTTLVRFDPVYVVHFKTNKKRLTEYPNIWAFTRDIYQFSNSTGNVKDTVNMFHIKHHYYESHKKINTYGIVAKGFDIDFDAPHGRESLSKL
jgi:putative glutathione S-transferase